MTACQHVDAQGEPDCSATATHQFLIIGVPAVTCQKHLPKYVGALATLLGAVSGKKK